MNERFKRIAEQYRKAHGIHASSGTDYSQISTLGSDDTFLNALKSRIHEVDLDDESALNRLVGLEDIKSQVISIRNQIAFYNDGEAKFVPPNGYHMCFSGPPGTGKTTVARILAGILFNYKVIRKPQIMELDGKYLKNIIMNSGVNDCMGRIIAKADGGVLFIDEAYLLMGDRLGYEIIGSLLTAMEDLRESLVVILAGYTKEMLKLVSLNPGLQSRIQYHIRFRNYTEDELFNIFTGIAGLEFSFAFDAGLFKEQLGIELRRTDFANGRDMRKFFQKMLELQADKCASGYGNRYVVLDDILESFIAWRKEIMIRDYAVMDTEDGDWIIVPQ